MSNKIFNPSDMENLLADNMVDDINEETFRELILKDVEKLKKAFPKYFKDLEFWYSTKDYNYNVDLYGYRAYAHVLLYRENETNEKKSLDRVVYFADFDEETNSLIYHRFGMIFVEKYDKPRETWRANKMQTIWSTSDYYKLPNMTLEQVMKATKKFINMFESGEYYESKNMQDMAMQADDYYRPNNKVDINWIDE